MTSRPAVDLASNKLNALDMEYKHDVNMLNNTYSSNKDKLHPFATDLTSDLGLDLNLVEAQQQRLVEGTNSGREVQHLEGIKCDAYPGRLNQVNTLIRRVSSMDNIVNFEQFARLK